MRVKPKGAYVYCITVDGVDRYIGKGRRDRFRDHFREARNINQRSDKRTGRKLLVQRRLAKAMRAGLPTSYRFIADGLSDADALAVERQLITEYPAGQLWNVVHDVTGALSAIAKQRWDCDEYRRKQSEATTKRWNDPEARERMVSRHREAMATQSNRDELRERSKALWLDPEYIKKQKASRSSDCFKSRHIAGIVSSITEDKRRAFGKRVAQSWKDPETRALRLKHISRLSEDRYAKSMLPKILSFVSENGPCEYRAIVNAFPGYGVSSALCRLSKRGLLTKLENGLYQANP